MSALPEGLVLDPVQRLTRDLAAASRTLSAGEARFLVDAYYTMQDQRIRSSNQIRSLVKSEEPHDVLAWFMAQAEGLEDQVKRALGAYAAAPLVGKWSLSQYGIGPVIAAGLLAHIDITKAPTVGHIWRFAGLDPTVTWKEGQKRPWNARLKVLCWKLGESFKRFSGKEACVYGTVYLARKRQEVLRNDSGAFADQAALTLAARPKHKQRAIYADGRLPNGRLDLRATRYAVKLFLAHWHHVASEVEYGTPPPKPYVIEHLGHAHFVAPPGWPIE
ncbi:MAG: hypothetical protein ACRD1Z_06430 [Vicinamibacteria bacterium]